MVPDASEVETADGSEPLVAVSFADSDYQRIPVDHEKLHESIVPVVTWTEGGPLIALGTAFAITQGGLFLTARHVVDEFLDEYDVAIDNGSAGLYLLWESARPVPSPHTSQPVPNCVGSLLPVRVEQHPTADLALLRVALPTLTPPIRFPRLHLDVGLPEKGRSCVALAYDRMKLSGDVSLKDHVEGSVITVDYERQLAAARGEILDVYPVRRDTSLLTWPSFQTGGRYQGGTSGGPVIGENGLVAGVVSRSDAVHESPDDGVFISAASLLISVLVMHAPSGVEGDPPTSISELCQSGVISVIGIEDVEVAGNPAALHFTSEAIGRAVGD